MSRKVLIIDQDPFSRNVFGKALSRRGYAVIQREDAHGAFEAIENHAVGLIVVDGALPDCDGVDLVRSLREDGSGELIIFLSSVFRNDSDVYRRLTEDLSVALVLHKPISPVEFGMQVDRLLGLDGEGLDPDSEVIAESESLRHEHHRTLESKLLELEALLARERTTQDVPLDDAIDFTAQIGSTAERYGAFAISEAMSRLRSLLDQMETRGASRDALEWNDVYDALDDAFVETRKARLASEAEAAPETPEWTATILVIDDDDEVLHHLRELGQQNFVRVITASRPREVFERVHESDIDGVIVDVDLGDGIEVGDIVRTIRERSSARELPMAFMGDEGAMHDRVEAAHLGAVLFIQKPVESADFSDAVHYLVSLRRDAQPHVLVVDDDTAFADDVSEMLATAGMKTSHLADSTRVLDELEEISPDGLIIKVTMPKIGGFDVCRMLRAMPRFHELPIIFVADRMNANTRIAAFRAGGDDYLVKPVMKEELLARLRVRIERLRLMRERADRDILTGLYTRRAFLQRVAARLSEVSRHDESLALCVLDLDHFKQINDTYGHMAGDRVLAAFGRLLDRRFRLEDLRARWGGEEFAIALVNEEPSTARRVIERVLDEFSSMTFRGDNGEEFSVTFSAGVAVYPDDGDDFESIMKAADRRLYAAKHAGRARVFTDLE